MRVNPGIEGVSVHDARLSILYSSCFNWTYISKGLSLSLASHVPEDQPKQEQQRQQNTTSGCGSKHKHTRNMAIVVMLAFSSYELLNDTCANTITLDTVYVESLNVAA